MRKRFWKGLRTIDLAVGLAIIFMVLTILVVRYDDFKCRAMQSEAKFSLQEVYAAQKLFFAEHDRYATLDQLIDKDARVVVPQKYYILSDLTKPTSSGFTIGAKGLPGTLVAGEEWSIDHEHSLALVKPICKE